MLVVWQLLLSARIGLAGCIGELECRMRSTGANPSVKQLLRQYVLFEENLF
jgi:hypothetical protein